MYIYIYMGFHWRFDRGPLSNVEKLHISVINFWGFNMDSPWIHHGFTMDQQVSWGLRWYMMVCGYFMLFSDAPSPDWGIGR